MANEVFITAEIGINHNGSLDLAKRLIDAAKWAGADAVKFQKRHVPTVYAQQLSLPRESPWGDTVGAQKFGLELSKDQYDAIAKHCEKIGMPWYCSAWDLESFAFLKHYDLPWNKVASAMVTNKDLVFCVASDRKPTYLSTAMCNAEDIEQARFIFEQQECPLTLMHCVGLYPCPDDQLNLRAITTLQKTFGLPVGYSGHESSVSPSVKAVVLGAVAVERHITTDRAMYGSDQAASLEPHGFRSMVEQIRKLPFELGDGIIRMTEPEREVAKKLRYWET